MRKLIPLLMIAIALSAFVLVKGPTVGATGGASKVLLAASEGPSIGAFLKAKLEAEGIPTVDVLMSSHAPAPPLATLLEYDTVIAWSDSPFDTGTAWGDVLADYVDAGGGLIINTFAFYTTPPYQLEGRIMTPGYSPLTPIQSVFGTSSLGAHDSSHPIMAGVTTVTSWYRDHTALDVGATLVASWADGRHMVAHNADCNIVGITLWPGREITPTSPYGWGGDVPRLFANAANFVADGCVVDTDGDGVLDDVDACPDVAGSLASGCPNKAEILSVSGVDGKGIANAPGLQKGFNPKSKATENAGKKK